MSVIRKKPFIEQMLEKMNEDEKADLQTLLDVGGGNVNATFGNLPEKGVTPVYFDFQNDTSVKTGILVYTDDHISVGEEQCVLLAYHKYQDISIFSIDTSNNTFKRIYEYCDIDELRRAVDDSIENEVISIDTNNDVTFGRNVEVDGDLKVNGGIDGKLTLKALTLTADTDGYVSNETFTNHVKILLEVETDGVHSGTDFVLHPYDNAVCLVAYRLLAGGSYVDGNAYIGDNGKVHIALPEDVSPTTIKGHFIEYED